MKLTPAAALSLLGAILLPMVQQEFMNACPHMARGLVRLAARLIPPAHRARYRQEWLAELDELEGLHLTMLATAARILLFAPTTGRALRASRGSVASRKEPDGVKRLFDLGVFVRRHAFIGTFLVTLAVLILAVAGLMFPLNSITAHRWTHNLPLALLLVAAFAMAQLARIIADIVGSRRGWSIAAALVTGALMVWVSVRVWMASVPRSGNTALDATLLMVLLTPTVLMIAMAEAGAQVARNTLDKVMPALGEPRRSG
jgi:hypothetical protein